MAIQKENLENELKTFTSQKDVNSKALDELKLDLKEKEPLLERMDASISEIDGALSPIFLSKQILLELEDVKTNLATHKNNFSKFSADSLDQITLQ